MTEHAHAGRPTGRRRFVILAAAVLAAGLAAGALARACRIEPLARQLDEVTLTSSGYLDAEYRAWLFASEVDDPEALGRLALHAASYGRGGWTRRTMEGLLRKPEPAEETRSKYEAAFLACVMHIADLGGRDAAEDLDRIRVTVGPPQARRVTEALQVVEGRRPRWEPLVVRAAKFEAAITASGGLWHTQPLSDGRTAAGSAPVTEPKDATTSARE